MSDGKDVPQFDHTGLIDPFWMMPGSSFRTPEMLREENESLKQIIAAQDERIGELERKIFGMGQTIQFLDEIVKLRAEALVKLSDADSLQDRLERGEL